MKCKIQLLDFAFPCQLRYQETAAFFQTITSENKAEDIAEISVSERDWEEIRAKGFRDSPHTEYSVLTPYFSEAMLPHHCVIIHAVALRWRDMAYLICAESGVGKSTQARFLQELRPGEFGIICGDRPILQFSHSERSEESVSHVPAEAHSVRSSPVARATCPPSVSSPAHKPSPLGMVSPQATDEGAIIVHPSPWNGKENWHGADAAPLAGLILLERGEENRLVALSEREAAIPMYPQFIHTGWNPETIQQIADLETRLLNTVSIWKLTTHDVPASTKLLLETVYY